MDKSLVDFLKSLSDEKADKIWLWLDGNPSAIEEMIKVISDSHKNLK